MIGIIVSGHLNFATGMQSAAKAITGEQEQFVFIDFLESMSTSELEAEMRKAVADVDTGDGVLFLTDLVGGSPCNRAMSIMLDTPNVELLAGVNLAMIANAAFERDGCSLEELTEALIEIGSATMKNMRAELKAITAQSDDDDGL